MSIESLKRDEPDFNFDDAIEFVNTVKPKKFSGKYFPNQQKNRSWLFNGREKNTRSISFASTLSGAESTLRAKSGAKAAHAAWHLNTNTS